jgi:hypothetical protein
MPQDNYKKWGELSSTWFRIDNLELSIWGSNAGLHVS